MSKEAAQSQNGPGRPRAARNVGKPRYWEGKLHALLVRKMDPYVEGKGAHRRLMVSRMAADFPRQDGTKGVAPFTIYNWMQNDCVPRRQGIKGLVELSQGRLTEKDLLPFLFA